MMFPALVLHNLLMVAVVVTKDVDTWHNVHSPSQELSGSPSFPFAITKPSYLLWQSNTSTHSEVGYEC